MNKKKRNTKKVWTIVLDDELVYYNDSPTLYFFRTYEAAKAEADAHGFKVKRFILKD